MQHILSEYLKYHLSNVMTDADLDIIVKLITEIFGDLFMRTGLLPWQIDTHKCPDEYLKDEYRCTIWIQKIEFVDPKEEFGE